jgi:hypothetical protein
VTAVENTPLVSAEYVDDAVTDVYDAVQAATGSRGPAEKMPLRFIVAAALAGAVQRNRGRATVTGATPADGTLPLYHWSPPGRRTSIRRQGLVPGSPAAAPGQTPAVSDGRPVLCLAYDPASAWALSAGMRWPDAPTAWDLWPVHVPGAATLLSLPQWGRATEVRTFARVPPVTPRPPRVAGLRRCLTAAARPSCPSS